MNVRPLRWWSKPALAEAAVHVDAAWRTWCGEWEVAAGPVVATNASELGTQRRQAAVWHRAPASSGHGPWVGIDGPGMDGGLAQFLFGPPLDPGPPGAMSSTRPQPVASEVASVALQDLLHSLAAAIGSPHLPSLASSYQPSVAAAGDVPVGGRPASADWGRWSGAITFELGCPAPGGIGLLAHLRPADAERLLATLHPSTAAVSANELRPSLQSISEQPLQISIQLTELSLDVGTLQSLRGGDVLLLPHRLHRPLDVRLVALGGRLAGAAGEPLCAAYLGARGEQRAVELIRQPALA